MAQHGPRRRDGPRPPRPQARRRGPRRPASARPGAAGSAGCPGRRRRGWRGTPTASLNRYVDYPRQLRRPPGRGAFDLYHLVDHSYAQLVHALPAGRAVVTCHDLDTFRCLLDPAAEPRPRWFRALARRTLEGLRTAAAVACDSEATRAAHPPPRPPARRAAPGRLPRRSTPSARRPRAPRPTPRPPPACSARPTPTAPEVLHVGSNIPRKRIDVLLDVFAGIRRAIPGARLVKVGGRFTPEQAGAGRGRWASPTRSRTCPTSSPAASRIAAVYRRAALVLQPSDAEGFGLPVAEAMACGAAVLASDLPVLREVGGDAALYRPVGDVAAWVEAALAYLEHRRDPDQPYQTMRAEGLARTSRFAWPAHVDSLMEMYRDVLEGRRRRPRGDARPGVTSRIAQERSGPPDVRS